MFGWKQGDSRWSSRTQISLTYGLVFTCTTTSSKKNIEPLRLAHSHFLVGFCIRRQSPSQSFVPLDHRSENESSGNNHFRHAPILVPWATILLTCGRDRELWPDPISEHVQSIRFIFSANQICQIWRDVRESQTFGVGQSQSSRSLPQVRRIVALGTRMACARGADYAVNRMARFGYFLCYFGMVASCFLSSRFPTAGQGERSSGNEIDS